MAITRGSVKFLVVLYSINVFITFVLSQLGMVRHWWEARKKIRGWLKKIFINGVGLVLSLFILSFMLIFKFHDGGWITLLITGTLVVFALLIRRHYYQTMQLLHRLNNLVAAAEASAKAGVIRQFDPKAKTAVLFINGFNGIGLHTLFGIIRLFGDVFKNFVFIQVGIVDVGNFKGVYEVDNLRQDTQKDLSRYVNFMQKQDFYAEGISLIGVDVIEEAGKIMPEISKRFPNVVIFGGQLVFPKETFLTRWLHNYTVFDMQRIFYRQGIPFIILPIRV
jgi:K+ transporter